MPNRGGRTTSVLVCAVLLLTGCSAGQEKSRPPAAGRDAAYTAPLPAVAYADGDGIVITGGGRPTLTFPVPKSDDPADPPAGGDFSWSADGRYVTWSIDNVIHVADTTTGKENSWPCPCIGGTFVGDDLVAVSLDRSILVVAPGAQSPVRHKISGPAATAIRASSGVAGSDGTGIVVKFEKGSKDYSFFSISPDGKSRLVGGNIPQQWPGRERWNADHSVSAFATASNGGPCGMSDRMVLLFPRSSENRLLYLPASSLRWNIMDAAWGADGKLYTAINKWFECNEKGEGIDYASTRIWRLDGGKWTDTGRQLAYFQPISTDSYIGVRLRRQKSRMDTGPPPAELIFGSLHSNATRTIARGLGDFAVSPRAMRTAGGADPPAPSASLPTPPVPVLGINPDPYQEGYGRVMPPKIFNGGDPTGLVENVHWSNWGAPQATATGTALWAPEVVADGTMEPVQVVASDLGSCHGVRAYRSLTWFFPQHGQKFDPKNLSNICMKVP